MKTNEILRSLWKIYTTNPRQLLLYLGRWQLSTPILALVPKLLIDCGLINAPHGGLSNLNWWLSAIITNIIGAFIIYPIDKLLIFRKKGMVIDDCKHKTI